MYMYSLVFIRTGIVGSILAYTLVNQKQRMLIGRDTLKEVKKGINEKGSNDV